MLKNAPHYGIPLLKMVDSLPDRQGEVEFVLRKFEQRYQDEIPLSHRAPRPDSHGRPRWNVYVRHNWQVARRSGLMDQPAPGLWHVTELGHAWLVAHPQAVQFDKAGPEVRVHDDRGEQYQVFWNRLGSVLLDALPDEVGKLRPTLRSSGNGMQMRLPSFGGLHYEIRLSFRYHEMALHFESNRSERNEAYRRIFEARQSQLSAALGQAVRVEPWRQWARVWLKLPVAAITVEQAEIYGKQTAQFVEATYPVLLEARRVVEPSGGRQKRYARLDEEVDSIHEFLRGRTAQHPTSEKLCDWVQFCYTFELFSEAQRLFVLVTPQDVNAWQYERAKRVAKICELRSHGG